MYFYFTNKSILPFNYLIIMQYILSCRLHLCCSHEKGEYSSKTLFHIWAKKGDLPPSVSHIHSPKTHVTHLTRNVTLLTCLSYLVRTFKSTRCCSLRKHIFVISKVEGFFGCVSAMYAMTMYPWGTKAKNKDGEAIKGKAVRQYLTGNTYRVTRPCAVQENNEGFLETHHTPQIRKLSVTVGARCYF